MRRFCIGFFAVLGWAAAQTGPLPRWVLDLSRAKRHLRANFERMPNYVCLETIHRFESNRRNPQFRPLDTVRLQVALVAGQEVFAWEGVGQLTESDPGSWIHRGLIGTGTFAGTARNLFVHDAGRTTGFGEGTDGGKRVLRFDFEIPEIFHPMQLQWGSLSGWVGERGSFRVDGETLDLLEIADNATDIPPELGIMETTTVIRYGRVRIGESEVILPASAETLMTRFDGTSYRNVTEFSACREYVADSNISFGPAFVSDSTITYTPEGKRDAPAPRPGAK